MLAAKKPLLLASAVMSATLLVGCSSEAVPEAAPSEAAPTTSAPTEEATPKAAPEQEEEDVEPLAVEPAPEAATSDEGAAPEEPSGSTEEELIAAIEEVMGGGDCYKRDEHTPGTPLETWTYDPYYIDDYYADHGALEGTLARHWCSMESDSSGQALDEGIYVSVGIFTDEGDFNNDKTQLRYGTLTVPNTVFFANDDELWTTTALNPTSDMFHDMEDLGASHVPLDYE